MTDPLVLVPGMMCDARVFLPQIIALASETSVQIAPIIEGENVEALARDILLRAPDRFALAGLSMGGIVAMEVLRLAPKRISRLALMDTSCQSELPNVAAARESQIVGARSGRLAEVVREEIKPDHLAPGPQRGAVLQTVMDMALYLGPDIFVRQSRIMQRRPDQQSTLRKSKTPTLIMCGEYDSLTPMRRHEFMAQLMPNAVLEVVYDAGHLPTLEQPEMVTNLLRRWLNAPSSQPLE